MSRSLLTILLALSAVCRAEKRPAEFKPIEPLPFNHDFVVPRGLPPPDVALVTEQKKTYQQAQKYLGPVYWGVGLGFNNSDHLQGNDRERISREDMNKNLSAKILYRLFFDPKTGAYGEDPLLSIETKEEGKVIFYNDSGLFYRFATAAAERLGKKKETDKAEVERLLAYMGKDPARFERLAKNLAAATKEYGHNESLNSLFQLIRSAKP